MTTIVRKTIVLAPVLLAAIYSSGCASLNRRLPGYDRAMSNTALDAGMARVCIARSPNMLGAIVPHYAVDCGTHATYDAKLIRPEDITVRIPNPQSLRPGERIPLSCVTIEGRDPMLVDRDRMDSVAFLVLSPALAPLANGVVTTRTKGFLRTINLQQTASGTYLVTQVDITPKVAAMAPNCAFVGSMKSGGYALYDRPPGTLRLRIVTPGGDEAFAPDFAVDADKRYVIDYQYGISGVQFTIHERP